MNFASDNATGAATEIIDALVVANEGTQLGYGNDELTQAVEKRICELFQTEAEVFLVVRCQLILLLVHDVLRKG